MVFIKTKKIMPAAVSLLLLFTSSAGHAQAEDTYSNPVLEESFRIRTERFNTTIGIGDPAVIYHDGTYYLYPTGDNYTYNVYTSPDLVNWEKGPVVFRSSEPGVWAPDVFHNPGDNMFYLYYTVNMRVGVAVSDKPDGMFKDRGALASDAIDAHMFLDGDGQYYLYYASYPALEIYVQPMVTPLKKKGRPTHLISPDRPWERKYINVTEAPWMLKHKGVYYLLYSGGGSDSMDYAIGYATSGSPRGPFKKHPQNPIVKKGGNVFGPGHGSVIKDLSGKLWMVYHQKRTASRGWRRFIAIDPLWFDEDGVLHGSPTRGSRQPAPATKAFSP